MLASFFVKKEKQQERKKEMARFKNIDLLILGHLLICSQPFSPAFNMPKNALKDIVHALTYEDIRNTSSLLMMSIGETKGWLCRQAQ